MVRSSLRTSRVVLCGGRYWYRSDGLSETGAAAAVLGSCWNADASFGTRSGVGTVSLLRITVIGRLHFNHAALTAPTKPKRRGSPSQLTVPPCSAAACSDSRRSATTDPSSTIRTSASSGRATESARRHRISMSARLWNGMIMSAITHQPLASELHQPRAEDPCIEARRTRRARNRPVL